MKTAARIDRQRMLAGTLQFLSEHSAQGLLEWLLPMLDVLVQGRVDERLVATAASLVHLALEPSQEIIIEPDGEHVTSVRRPEADCAVARFVPLRTKSVRS